jgi:hypothetical protein
MEGFVNPFKGVVVTQPPRPRPRFRRFREPSRKGILFLCWLLVFASPIALVTARPAYLAFKDWRSDRLTGEAEALTDSGQWDSALNTASAAYLLAPQSPRTVRLVANLLTHFGSERALDFWQLAVTLDPDRTENRRSLIATALRYEQLPLAETHAAELLRRAGDVRENIVSAATVARAARDYTREYRLLNRARTKWPNDDGIRFQLNRAMAVVGTQREVREAIVALREDALRQDPTGLEALEFFADRPAEDFPDRQRYALLLRNHPLAGGQQLAAAAAVEIDAQPEARPQFLEQLLGAVAGRDAATKGTVAEWLLRIGENPRVLQLLPWAEVREAPKLALAHLDALSRTGDRAALDRLLATPGLPVRKEFSLLCRWQAGRAAEEGPANDRDAIAAIEVAIAFPASLHFIASRFEEAARYDLATQAFSRLRHAPRFRSVALMGLLRLARRDHDTRTILDLLEQARLDGSTDPAALGDIAYYELLLKRNVHQNRQLAAKLAAQYPDRMSFFATLALACLSEEDFAGALRTFELGDFHWRRATNGMKAIYAASLDAAGRTAEAHEVAGEVNPETLLPEERALLGSVREWVYSKPR